MTQLVLAGAQLAGSVQKETLPNEGSLLGEAQVGRVDFGSGAWERESAAVRRARILAEAG